MRSVYCNNLVSSTQPNTVHLIGKISGIMGIFLGRSPRSTITWYRHPVHSGGRRVALLVLLRAIDLYECDSSVVVEFSAPLPYHDRLL